MSKTVDGFRVYQCKRCGQEVKENIHWWRKKSQNKKNICFECLRKRDLAVQTHREMCEDRGMHFY